MFNRRRFLRKLAYLMAALHIPYFSKAEAGEKNRPLILRIHSENASNLWDYQASAPWDHTVEPTSAEEMKSKRFRADRYYDSIDEEVLARMLSRGLQHFTSSDSQQQAWMKLLSGYRDGDSITIKVNLNNASFDEEVTTNRMDQSPQMINVLLESLISSLNISERKITVADPSRWIHPGLIKERCTFKGIRWIDSTSKNLWGDKEIIKFSSHQPIRPPNKPNFPHKTRFHVTRVYTEADHILNVCLLKNHGCGITGAMKNHFGSFPPPFAKYLHDGLGSKSYIGDVCNTPSIKEKVRLNICEAVFGNWHNNVWCPRPWKTFKNKTPNSLFLGTDPVAFDSVLLQHIIDEVAFRGDSVEQWVRDAVQDHGFLDIAMNSLNLGIHEHKPFQKINYQEIESA